MYKLDRALPHAELEALAADPPAAVDPRPRLMLKGSPQHDASLTALIEVAQNLGGIIGLAVQWGVQRGIYSNEAGQGTGPHAAAAAEVSHPAKQGLVQAFAVYVDTLFICSARASGLAR